MRIGWTRLGLGMFDGALKALDLPKQPDRAALSPLHRALIADPTGPHGCCGRGRPTNTKSLPAGHRALHAQNIARLCAIDSSHYGGFETERQVIQVVAFHRDTETRIHLTTKILDIVKQKKN